MAGHTVNPAIILQPNNNTPSGIRIKPPGLYEND